jgi:hypothetical protein
MSVVTAPLITMTVLNFLQKALRADIHPITRQTSNTASATVVYRHQALGA